MTSSKRIDYDFFLLNTSMEAVGSSTSLRSRLKNLGFGFSAFGFSTFFFSGLGLAFGFAFGGGSSLTSGGGGSGGGSGGVSGCLSGALPLVTYTGLVPIVLK